MSRRTGPGGRLRPAPRMHRNTPRADSPRLMDVPVPHAMDGTGAASVPAMGLLDDVDDVTLADFDVDDETGSAGPVHRVIGPELDVGPGEASQRAVPAPRPAGGRPGPQARPEPRPDRPDRVEQIGRSAPACTTPQLRRFIKSRAYVPMHELRRRFAIDGGDDDVTGLELDCGRIFVGLPAQEGRLLGDLLRGGEVGFELSFDPQTPVVVGVYAMRPVPRT